MEPVPLRAYRTPWYSSHSLEASFFWESFFSYYFAKNLDPPVNIQYPCRNDAEHSTQGTNIRKILGVFSACNNAMPIWPHQ